MSRRPPKSGAPRVLALALASVLALGACEASPPEQPTPPAEGVPASVAPALPTRPAASPASPSAASGATVACSPTDQDRYVYDPGRLTVKARCLRVSGVIDAVRQEADGDLHILLRLDAAYRRYLTPANQGEELGDLVVEPVCVHPVTQADAIAACAADPDPLQDLPHTGMRVWMEGRWVLDTDHGDWAELHPLYRWGTGTTTATAGSAPAATPISGAAGTGLRVRFTDVPSPAPIGGSATIGARTSAGAACSIRVTLPSGRVSAVAALRVTETADGSGDVSWTWSVGPTTKPGTATAAVACALGSKAGSATTSFSME